MSVAVDVRAGMPWHLRLLLANIEVIPEQLGLISGRPKLNNFCQPAGTLQTTLQLSAVVAASKDQAAGRPWAGVASVPQV